MLAPQTSSIRQRVRSGCHTCKVRKVKCKSDVHEDSAGPDELSRCDSCKRLGLNCRWSAPVAGEEYTPPPKRRQTIGRRRERSSNSNSNKNTESTYSLEASQASRPQENPASHVHGTRPPEHLGSNFAQAPLFELDAYVDMLGDLPFNTDFDLDINPVGLHFNGEGLGFAPPATLDHLFPVPAGEPGDSINLTNITNPSISPQFFQHQAEKRPSAGLFSEISSLGTDEQHLIQHYLATMTGYAKVDDSRGANNLYITAFTQSLSFQPLLYAILAFSASHLALENNTYFEKASKYEQLAHDSFEACKEHASEPDSLLSALFVRAKRVHLIAGEIKSFHSLISEATQIILSERGQRALKDPFSLAQRIIIRLALLDARASCYRLGGGTLIKALRHIPAMSFIFNLEGTDGLAPNALVSLLRADILRMKVGELDLRLRLQMESEDLVTSPVRTEEIRSLHQHIEHEIRQWEYQMSSRGNDPDDVPSTDCVLEASTYAQYLVMAALHSAILYLYILYPLPTIKREHSVARILHCQLKLQQDPSRTSSPSSLVPSSLFLAGVCTLDPIHRDWVLERLKNGKRWGMFLGRTRELLVAIMKARSAGDEVDIRTLMDQLQGRFLI